MTTNYLDTVMRQYGNSTTLGELLAYSDQWLDPEQFTADFLSNVWDISTAVGFGLDIWGRILGQSRNLQVTPTADDNFGFYASADASGSQPWNAWSQAPFYGGQSSGTVAVALADDYYRKLLLVKAASNIAKCDVQSINSLMRAMYGSRGKCYCGYSLDEPMHIGYHFEFTPTNIERSIIESGIFPAPAGMKAAYIYQTLTYAPFGFRSANYGTDTGFVVGWSQNPFYSTT